MVDEMAPHRSTGYVDPGWEHGVAQDEKKKKVKCNFCGKIVSGGVFRLKQHLARMSGEVTHCEKVPDDVCLNMRKNLEGCRSGRRRRQSRSEEAVAFHPSEYDDTEETSYDFKYKGKKVVSDENAVMRLAPLRSLGYVDPGWEHCVPQDERKKRVKCNYCEKTISGGINRFKQHLARIPGEVAYCEKAPENVYLKIKENMKWHRTGRRHRKPDTREISAFYMHSDNEDEEHEEGFLPCMDKDILVIDDKNLDSDIRSSVNFKCSGSSITIAEPLLKKSRLDSVFLKSLESQTLHSKQVKPKRVFEKKTRKEVISAISKFFYHAGIPSNAANSPYFQKMLELVGQYGQGLQGPSSRLISGRFLQEEIASVKEYLAECKASWAITGCSIMIDSWNDAHGRTIINFLVSCPRGVYFHSSLDATDIIDDTANLCNCIDKVVEEIGEEKIVQVITKNTASFRTVGKMLEELRSHLFWTPCAVHCIDRMLEDFINIKWVGECIDKAKKITRFIYNSTWLLSLMKKEFTSGQDLIRPAVTKFATSFFSIQNLLDHRIELKKMLQCSKWLSSQLGNSDDGREVERIILNITFWKKMHYVRKTLEPVAQVAQKIHSYESRSIPFIYNDMYRAKLAIKAIHGDDVRRYGPFWSVIDSNWNSLLQHPLYVAAYFLNPSYRYRPDFIMHPEVFRGLNECIVRLEADSGRRISASMQIPDYVSAKADFGTDLAMSTRTELDPASWWQQHGISCLELQRIAIQILSQSCSSIGCEHTWSMYDQVHAKRNSSLSQKSWNDRAYVHYNLRLRECQLSRKPEESISFDSGMLESVLDDWLVEPEKQNMQGNEEILYNEMDQQEADEDEEEEEQPREVITEASILETSEVNPGGGGVITEDDGLDFLDDDLTD